MGRCGGEVGPLGIELGESPAGEAYRDFQHCLKDLSLRGCLLAVCSKNNLEDAQEPFTKNRDMVLALEDFAAFEASWQPKERGLERISETLRLGLQDFVFFDDNPAERERVRHALPEVEVAEVKNLSLFFLILGISVTAASHPKRVEASPSSPSAADRVVDPGNSGIAEISLASLKESGTLQMFTGKSLVISSANPLTRVSVTDPEIASIQVLSPQQVLIHSKAPGAVTLLLWG